jgi:hypothetical protein
VKERLGPFAGGTINAGYGDYKCCLLLKNVRFSSSPVPEGTADK